MNFNRDAEDTYSLTELAVLHALGEESINSNATITTRFVWDFSLKAKIRSSP
ncbi:MAG: hypothetical protein OXC80_13075 [Gammaproteobacteria bacterium]|nr:hypothetical protein [Gammaproteobacteria bacterium]